MSGFEPWRADWVWIPQPPALSGHVLASGSGLLLPTPAPGYINRIDTIAVSVHLNSGDASCTMDIYASADDIALNTLLITTTAIWANAEQVTFLAELSNTAIAQEPFYQVSADEGALWWNCGISILVTGPNSSAGAVVYYSTANTQDTPV